MLALLLVGPLAGCLATKPVDDADLRLQAASAAFGGDYEYLIVGSAGKLADEAFIAISRATGPSAMARDLGTRIAPARDRPVRVMVTGADGKKTLQVIEDAFSLHERLPHLEFLFLGEPGDAPRVREIVEGAGATFHFAPFAM